MPRRGATLNLPPPHPPARQVAETEEEQAARLERYARELEAAEERREAAAEAVLEAQRRADEEGDEGEHVAGGA